MQERSACLLLPGLFLCGLCFMLLANTVAGILEEDTANIAKVQLNENQIQRYFQLCDMDRNELLSQSELEKWIKIMIESHLKDNVVLARQEFRDIDKDRDGIITWEEYKIMMKEIHDHDSDHHVYTEQEQRHKFRQADENGDGVLNQLEYVAFRNPMTTAYILDRIANELLEDFDGDKDSVISLDEFVHHSPSREDDNNDVEISKIREQEFRNVIDSDGDGFLQKEELRKYLDPREKHFISNEARHMIHESDSNSDGKLNIDEIKENYLHFQTHKQNPVVRALHDEF